MIVRGNMKYLNNAEGSPNNIDLLDHIMTRLPSKRQRSLAH